ncbi:MAG: M15 family metallopeptidase [Hyphomicrobiaceae bacterium]
MKGRNGSVAAGWSANEPALVPRSGRWGRLGVVALAAFLATGALPAASEPLTAGEGGRRLVAAYPDFLASVDGNELVWKDGTRMSLDDGRAPKPFSELLAAPDIKDMFRWGYPAGRPAEAPGVEVDPGRVRYQPLFDKMYGDCTKGGTKAHLVEITWLPKKARQRLLVSRVNGVDKRLAAVSRVLDELPARFDRYLFPAAGTFNCRPIAGTTRPSAHGAGIAIDIAIKHAHYWRWTKPDKAGRYPYRNSIPMEIVAAFEKEGFVWGGRWYHYDTMHFEYRPELIDRGAGCQGAAKC